MDLKKLSKIKDSKFRKLVAQMSLTWEIIQRMEQYHKEHYANKT